MVGRGVVARVMVHLSAGLGLEVGRLWWGDTPMVKHDHVGVPRGGVTWSTYTAFGALDD